MEEQILRPRRGNTEIKGKISYQESNHTWSLLNLRKPIIDEFPQLKERTAHFGYKMVFCHEYSDLERFIRKLKKEGQALPILMWLVKEKAS